MTLQITRKEAEFAFIGTILIIAWFLFLRDILAPFLQIIPPIFAMLIYNFGLFTGLYLLASPLNGGAKQFKFTAFIFIMFLGVDILYAPYMVNIDGSVRTSIDYWYVSTDAGFGTMYSMFLPLFLVWIFTYVITPIILIFLIPVILLKPKQIAKAFGH